MLRPAVFFLAVVIAAASASAREEVPLLKDLRKAAPTTPKPETGPETGPETTTEGTPETAAADSAPADANAAETAAATATDAERNAPRPRVSIIPSEAIRQVPLLSDLRKPVEEAPKEKVEEVVVPEAVVPGQRIADPAAVLPAGAVWYIASPDAVRLAQDWKDSPTGKFFAEPAMEQTMRNNRFGLGHLFSDLPASVVSPGRVGAMGAALELAAAVAKFAEKMACAVYLGDDGRFNFVFLFDVGLDRAPSFEVLAEWETTFYLANPATTVVRGNHAGNFLDVWTLPGSTPQAPAELAAGYLENMLIISTDVALGQAALSGGGDNIASSTWGQRLAASKDASASADAIGYLRMDALLKGLEGTPIAHDSVTAWADYIGHGGRDGEATYYGVQFTAEGTRETFLLPNRGQSASSSLVELLARRLRPAQKWMTPNILPYQPNPYLFIAAQLEGRQLGQLLRQERRLFGLSNDNEYFTMPPAARRLFTNEILGVLTGEMGLAFYPGPGNRQAWVMVLPCTENPLKLLPKAESEVDRSGSVIFSRETVWREGTAWTVLTQEGMRRVSGNFLVIASHGDLILNTIDQVVASSSFSNNRDFARALAQAEDGPGLIFYLNLPEIAIRQYSNLSQLMRAYYPRSSGLNSRPPLAMLRRYGRGVLGAIEPFKENGGSFTRVTVQSPVPVLGGLTVGMLLNFPRGLRDEGRKAMTKSRENLQSLWLRTQLYSSRFGHFPDHMEDLVADMRSGMQPDEMREMLVAPAALSRFGEDEAMRESYRYLSGATPQDEPDLPLFYETEPWSEDFVGMYPANRERAPTESGEFVPFRQYIRLDGGVVTTTERRFQADIMPRLRERE